MKKDKHSPGRKSFLGDEPVMIFARVSKDLRDKVKETAESRGFVNQSEYIRHVLENDALMRRKG